MLSSPRFQMKSLRWIRQTARSQGNTIFNLAPRTGGGRIWCLSQAALCRKLGCKLSVVHFIISCIPENKCYFSALLQLALAPLGLAQRGCWYVRIKRWSVALLRALLVRARWVFRALLVRARWACFALRVVGTCALSVLRVVGTCASARCWYVHLERSARYWYMRVERALLRAGSTNTQLHVASRPKPVLRTARDQQTCTCMLRHVLNLLLRPRTLTAFWLWCGIKIHAPPTSILAMMQGQTPPTHHDETFAVL